MLHGIYVDFKRTRYGKDTVCLKEERKVITPQWAKGTEEKGE